MPPAVRRLVILGAGYVGRHLFAQASGRGFRVWATSRTPRDHLASLPPPCRLEFDLARPETWRNVPPETDLVWCFPAEPVEAVAAFAAEAAPRAGRLIVLGSTAAYVTGERAATDVLLDESAAVDRDRPRVLGEECLRRDHRAVLLRVAGIYGPGRNVLDWIRQGRIKGLQRFVNLVHVEDLTGICLAALDRARAGEVYNVSDGRPRRWADICREAERRWGIPAPPSAPDGRTGKRLSIVKLVAELGYRFRHPDLFEALAAVEAGGLTHEARR